MEAPNERRDCSKNCIYAQYVIEERKENRKYAPMSLVVALIIAMFTLSVGTMTYTFSTAQSLRRDMTAIIGNPLARLNTEVAKVVTKQENIIKSQDNLQQLILKHMDSRKVKDE